MKPKIYKLLEFSVENGTRRGIARTEKHMETELIESEHYERLIENIVDSVMLEVCEWFEFKEQQSVNKDEW